MAELKSESLMEFGKRVLVGSLVVLAVLAGAYIVYLARTPLIWIGIAGFMAVAINPIVHHVQRYMPRRSIGLATLLILLSFCVALGALTWLFFAPVVEQTAKLLAEIPTFAKQAKDSLTNSPLSQSTTVQNSPVSSYFQSSGGQLTSLASQAVQLLLSIFTSLVDATIALISIISLMFFMTIEGADLKRIATKMVTSKKRAKALQLGHQVYNIINGYIIGNVLLSFMYGVSSALVLWLSGSPYFLVLGLISGLLDLIPLVGSSIAAIIVAIVCLLSGQVWAAGIFVAFTIVYVQVENSVLNPMVYSKNVDISPLVVLMAVLIGASVAGIVGTLLAIPAAATIKVFAKLIWDDRLNAA